jgi:hypothetical protein
LCRGQTSVELGWFWTRLTWREFQINTTNRGEAVMDSVVEAACQFAGLTLKDGLEDPPGFSFHGVAMLCARMHSRSLIAGSSYGATASFAAKSAAPARSISIIPRKLRPNVPTSHRSKQNPDSIRALSRPTRYHYFSADPKLSASAGKNGRLATNRWSPADLRLFGVTDTTPLHHLVREIWKTRVAPGIPARAESVMSWRPRACVRLHHSSYSNRDFLDLVERYLV